MKHVDALNALDALGHVTGESCYVDDIPLRAGCLHGAVLAASIARGEIVALDTAPALRQPGVVAVFTAADIPGENQIGNILADEPLMADGVVHYCGQPVALVVAHTEAAARAARAAIQVEYRAEKPVVEARQAYAEGRLLVPPRCFEHGQPDQAWADCAHVVEGEVELAGQEHLYLETQGSYAYPGEGGDLHITASTQGPTGVQRTMARVAGMAMHRVEVEVRRLGGGFGGKEDQATAWAVLAGLAARLTNRPVKLILHRLDDMVMTGKRHPYSADFKLGLDSELRFLCYEVHFYQNAGAAADLSPAVLERTLFHATNSYAVPHVRATGYCCRTNLPPFTAFRGFGGPQAMFVIEAAITAAAEALGVEASVLQANNLLDDGDVFPYGQRATAVRARPAWQEMDRRYDLEASRLAIAEFNATHTLRKRGLACMPICFGISFTNTSMNQARALVHIYQDGSVGISTGAVEMGQGVNTKMAQVAAEVLGIDPARIKVETTNTTRIANTSPSAASATADLNGKALQLACEQLRRRLLEVARSQFAAEIEAVEFTELVQAAYLARVSLSEHAHYATPEIHFDTGQERGHPFAYHVYGSAMVTAEVDCLRGIYRIEKFEVVHDSGAARSPMIDRGQIEGGIVQGMGWMTCEELVFDADGRLRSDALSNYKVPDLHMAPAIELATLPASPSPHALLGSKAVGEPPLMYGIGAYFALRAAIRAYRPEAKLAFVTPLTPERVLMALHGGGGAQP